MWTGKAGAEDQLLRVGVVHVAHASHTFSELQRGFERFGQPLFDVFTDTQSIDDGFDGVFFVLVQIRRAIQIDNKSVHARANETTGNQLLEYVQVLTFAIVDDGREDHDASVARQCEYLIHHLTDGLCRKRCVVGGASRLANPGVKQA